MKKKYLTILIVILLMGLFYSYFSSSDEKQTINTEISVSFKTSESINKLTEETRVINYVKINHRLPKFYLKKKLAKSKGWNPYKGNLCDVLPGRAIGGDYFRNREGKLPKNNEYYEADVNYDCGRRQADRIVYTKSGNVWLTKDHYKTFKKK